MATVFEICEAQSSAGAEMWYTCQSLGLENIQRERSSQAEDSVTFEIRSGTALTDNPIFSYKTHVRLRKVVDGTPEYWFYGRVMTIPRSGNGPDPETQKYTIVGPWEEMEKTTYRQEWVESAGTISKPRVILYMGAGGSRMTSGEQIEDVIDWARTCGISIAAPSEGDIITGAVFPFDEQVNMSCADVIADCLRLHPHAVTWFDYSQRDPVFHVGLRTALPAVSVAASQVAEDIEIDERRDIQPDGICICYEKPVQDGEATWSFTEFDWAPVVEEETPAERAARLNRPDVIWATFDLQGYTANYLTQKIVTESFPADYTDKAWWKAREPWLQDYADGDITITDAGRMDDTDLPRILKEGTMQPWMDKEAAQERICAKIRVTKKEGAQVVVVEDRPVTHTVTATDATEKTYKTLQSVDSGESVPEGVAAALWAEWSTLHCEGGFTIMEGECSGTYAPGKALNITGGQAAWATMAAMISRTVEHIDSGTTTVVFGPARTVDVDTIVSFFRKTRNRRFAFSRQIKDGSNTPEDPGYEGSADLNLTAGYSGLTTVKRRVILDIAAEVKHLIDLDSGAFAFAESTDGETARTIKPRERPQLYLDGSGDLACKLAQVLCSENYGEAINLATGERPADPSNPLILGTASEGASDDALTDTYDGTAPGNDGGDPPVAYDGVKIFLETRDRYMDAGSKTLYAYGRWLTFPAPIAPSVGVETRITIDAPT